jgi:hypothetical protein
MIVWIHYARPRSSWYGLDGAEQGRLREKWAAVDAATAVEGGQPQGTYQVRGQSDYSTVELWRFPSYDAAYAHWSAKLAAGYAQWFAFANNVGATVSAPTMPEGSA